MSSEMLILLPVSALLIGMILEACLFRVLSPRGKGWLAFLSAAGSLVGVLLLWPATMHGEALDITLLTWDGPANLAYHIDGLSQLFALMAAAIGAAVLLYAVGYMAEDPGATRFYVLMLAFIAGLVNLVYSADMLLMYASWEIIGLCSYLLVGFWYQQREAAAGARKVLVMTHIAGYGLLAAVLLLYGSSGSTLWTDPAVSASLNAGLFALILVSAVAKSVQFPLHTWIPDAMAAPTPVSALLHAACYVKAGVYIVARLHSFGPWPPGMQTLVIWIGTITLLVGSLYAMIQSDMKRLLAFSTVSQIGYMMLGLGIGTPLGIAAGLLHCLNHGFFKGGLFLCAGGIQHETGTRDMDQLGGLAQRMPVTMGAWLALAGSIVGLPLLSGFVSKWLIYNAALEAGQVVPALIAWIASIITVFYFLKATSGVFLGEPTPQSASAHEVPPVMRFGLGALALVSILLGVAPQIAIKWVINPLLAAVGSQPVIGISWAGLTAGSGSWLTTAGVIMAATAIVPALLFYWLGAPRRRTAAVGAGIFTGGEPLSGPGRLPASDFSLMVRDSLKPLYDWLNPDVYYRLIWRGLKQIGSWLQAASQWLERYALLILPLVAVGLIIVVGVTTPGASDLSGLSEGLPYERLALAGIGLAAVALTLVAFVTFETVTSPLLVAAAGALAILALFIDGPLIRVLLLESSALVTCAALWQSKSTGAARIYLVVVLLSAASIIAGMLLVDRAAPAWVIALLLTGYSLKMALLPLYLWLPRAAEDTPAVLLGLLVAVIDAAAFTELLTMRSLHPWVFDPPILWLILGAGTAVISALLMLAQKDMKRLLIFSTIEDMGVLTIGLTLGGQTALMGVGIGVMVHALAKALLFISVGSVEAHEPATLDNGGLAARYPLAGAAFLVGTFAILGVPPTLGYASHWRLYSAAGESHPVLLVVLLVTTGLAVLAYARAVTAGWWGTGSGERRRLPALTGIVLVCLSVLLVIAGIWPESLGWLLTQVR